MVGYYSYQVNIFAETIFHLYCTTFRSRYISGLIFLFFFRFLWENLVIKTWQWIFHLSQDVIKLGIHLGRGCKNGLHITFHENSVVLSHKYHTQLYYSENDGNKTHSPFICNSGIIPSFERYAWNYIWHYFEYEGVMHLIPVQLVSFCMFN